MTVPNAENQREAQLYARVAATKEAYYQARAAAAELQMIRDDVGPNHPDGRASALNAAHIERHALEAYGKALREFAAFVLRDAPGKPDTQE